MTEAKAIRMRFNRIGVIANSMDLCRVIPTIARHPHIHRMTTVRTTSGFMRRAVRNSKRDSAMMERVTPQVGQGRCSMVLKAQGGSESKNSLTGIRNRANRSTPSASRL